MSQESQYAPPPQPQQNVWQRRTREQDQNGRIREQTIMNPFGHRTHQPGLNDALDTIFQIYAGALDVTEVKFSHIPEKERKDFYANIEAAVALRKFAHQFPSALPIYQQWVAGRIIGRGEVSMGVNGAAVTSENTKINVNKNVEQKSGGLFRRK
jgi:hypothetical protein